MQLDILRRYDATGSISTWQGKHLGGPPNKKATAEIRLALMAQAFTRGISSGLHYISHAPHARFDFMLMLMTAYTTGTCGSPPGAACPGAACREAACPGAACPEAACPRTAGPSSFAGRNAMCSTTFESRKVLRRSNL